MNMLISHELNCYSQLGTAEKCIYRMKDLVYMLAFLFCFISLSEATAPPLGELV